MSRCEDRPEDSADIDEVAAIWFHRLESENAAETRHLFERWLNANAAHAEAFARTTAIWNDFGEHAAAPEMMAFRQAAIEDSRKIGLSRWQSRMPEPNHHRRALLAACLAIASLAVAGYLFLRAAPAQVYATQIGERRSLILADRSRVDIDANSQISVAFTGDRRLIRILRGQAYFEVERDASRPFIVQANGRAVIATGTEFDVDAFDDGVQVTLIKGHVLVRRTSAAEVTSSPSELEPGDQLTDRLGDPLKITHLANTLEATSWRQGKLLFNDVPLVTAVARFNRYSNTVVVADHTVGDIRIGGAFNVGNLRDFMAAVRAYYPVDVVSDRPGEVRLTRRK